MKVEDRHLEFGNSVPGIAVQRIQLHRIARKKHVDVK